MDKWVELEVLKCMWRNDSKLTRDSFREFSKVLLSLFYFFITSKLKFRQKHLSEPGGFTSKPPPLNSGPNNSHRGIYNTAQQPLADFRSSYPTQQSLLESRNGPNTTYQPPVNFASLNPIRVSGEYNTTYYPLPNGTYEAIAQAPSFRRSDTVVEDLVHPRDQPLTTTTEAYSSYGAPGLSHSASTNRPSRQSTTRSPLQHQANPDISSFAPHEPSLPVHRVPHPADIYRPNRERELELNRSGEPERSYERGRDHARKLERGHERGYESPGLSHESSIKRPLHADVATSSRPSSRSYPQPPGGNSVWKHSLLTPRSSRYTTLPSPPLTVNQTSVSGYYSNSREDHPLQNTDPLTTSYG